jgi:hypothetical protein
MDLVGDAREELGFFMQFWKDIADIFQNVAVGAAALLGALYGRRAINQWLTERKGGEKYALGMTIVSKARVLSKKLQWLWTASSIEGETRALHLRKTGGGEDDSVLPRWYEDHEYRRGEVGEMFEELITLNEESTVHHADFEPELTKFREYLSELDRIVDVVWDKESHDNEDPLPRRTAWSLSTFAEEIDHTFTPSVSNDWYRSILTKARKQLLRG